MKNKMKEKLMMRNNLIKLNIFILRTAISQRKFNSHNYRRWSIYQVEISG